MIGMMEVIYRQICKTEKQTLMKNIIFYTLSLLLAITSCQREETNYAAQKKGFNVTIVVDELETGVKTRASIPSLTGETDVNSLYLVFFQEGGSSNGEYIGYHKVNAASLEMSSTVAVPTTITSGATVDDSQSYTILAFANMKKIAPGINGYTDNIDDFLADFVNHTKNSALQKVVATVSGAGTDEADNDHAIASNNLFMSAQVVKEANQSTTTIKLKRGVSRFDVINDASGYVLASVSIWGAAKNTTVWEGAPLQYEPMQRFYGITGITGQETKGKLYAFENTVLEPVINDKVTTCLIIGLKEEPGDDKILYYRVNVNMENSAQNLKRNNSYQITIKNVVGEGSSTEYEAWTQSRNQLVVSINNWNLDDNGMIITDGTNALGLTVKRITFDPQGDIREYSLFTAGTGVLEITRTDFPFEDDGITPAFTAVIEENVLKVTATKLPVTKEIRRGSIEVSFAGLRGSINMVQEPMNEKLLKLDRTAISNFDPVGRNGIADGALTVTASGPWVADIYNVDDTEGNPGFSFISSGDPSTHIDSETNPYENSFQIYTTGDNPYVNNQRSGFVIVSLVEDPDNFAVAIPLIQEVKPVFQIIPTVTDVRFYADASPVNANIAVGNMYEFTVNTGGKAWNVELSGGNVDKFQLTPIAQRKFNIKALQQNISATALTTTIKITSDGEVMEIPVIQQIPVISASFTSQIPANGGNIHINVSSSNLPWNAEIVENWNSGSSTNAHLAWLEASTDAAHVTELTNQSANGTFKVGFDALNFPLVYLTPKVKIKVSINGLPAINQIIEVVQLPLKPGTLNVMDVRHTSYGSLGGGGDYFTGYNDFLRASSLFGLNGIVHLPTISITEKASGTSLGTISSEFRYLHAGGNPMYYDTNRFMRVENWRLQNDGIVVYASDSKGDQFTNSESTLVKLGYEAADKVYAQPAKINTDLLTNGSDLEKNIMNYLLNDGPFGVVNNPGSLTFTMNGICVSLKSYGGVPVIVNGDGNAMLVLDPGNRLVYIGEGQMFDSGYNIKIQSDKDRLLGNLLSYVLNAALNGSAFTEIFFDNTRYNEKFR